MLNLRKTRAQAPNRDPMQPQPQRGRSARPWRRLRRRRLIALATAFIVVGAIFPKLVSLTPVQRLLTHQIAGRLPGDIRIGHLRLAWWDSVRIESLQVLGSDEKELASFARIETRASLWRLVCAPRQLGTIRVDGANVRVAIRPGGSNWEDFFAALASSTPSSSSSNPVRAQVHIRDATVQLVDTHGRTDQITDVNGWLDVPSATESPVTFAASCNTKGTPAVESLHLKGSWFADQKDCGKLTVHAILDSLSLDLTRYVAQRCNASYYASGSASGHCFIALKPSSKQPIERFQSQLTFSPLNIVARNPSNESLRIPTATVQIDTEGHGSEIDIKQGRVESNLVSTDLQGRFDTERWRSSDDRLRHLFERPRFQFDGWLNLAELGRQIPRTLRLREDVQLTSGFLRWHVNSQDDDQMGGRIDGRLDTVDLVARRGPSTIQWRDPIQVDFQWVADHQGPRVERLTLRAPSVRLDAQGQRNQGRMHADVDLSRLTNQLAQLMDLGDVHLGGRLQSDIRWQSTVADDWQIEGHVGATDVLIAGIPSIPRAAGEMDMTCRLRPSRDACAIDELRMSIRQLEIMTPERTLSEPELRIDARGTYDILKTQLSLTDATAASTSISLKADTLDCTIGQPYRVTGVAHCRADLARLWQQLNPSATARPAGEWTGNVNVAMSPSSTSIRANGKIQDFEWQARDDQTRQNASRHYQTLWHEPSVSIDVSVVQPENGQPWQISNAACHATSFGVDVAGNVSATHESTRVDVHGHSNLNLDAIFQQCRPWLGPDIRLTGNARHPFWLKGPLPSADSRREPSIDLARHARSAPRAWVPEDLEGEFATGWQRMSAYGIEGGAANLQARLHRQTVTLDPFYVPLSTGRVRLAPRLNLVDPLQMSLEKGPLVERVSITPEMCRTWLKYVTPIVAGATSAQGQFSVRVAHAEVPVMNPHEASVAGSVTVHDARIGPGPLAQQLLQLVQIVRSLDEPGRGLAKSLDRGDAWLVIPEQVFSFRVDQGQVSHQNLRVQIGDVTVTTRGSVGFDQRLALVADVPIQKRWVANRPQLAGLTGQNLSVRIQGSLQQPRLDERAIQNQVRQIMRTTAEGMLQHELQRQMKRLLPGQ